MEKKWFYDAFISYRHTALDSFVAKNLHKQLESFKLPSNVARRRQESDEEAKTKITRVFRDQEELPLVSNLADPIMEALEQSEFLIVICSPRLNESMWCKKEIETFIKLRGREHVLLVLIEGEPEDSFPEELLYREVEETAEDGTVITKKVPVEPLAADVRGSSPSEVKKKIKSEVLRLAAPMFACSYDDLRQRHRERRMRKIITASLAGSAICLLFGLVSTTMALQIRRQNIQITAQSEEISAQAEEIERQYAQAMRSASIAQGKESLGLLERGDRIAAIKTALQAFPGGDKEDVPYTAQAAYALSESLNLYENNTQILPDRLLEADTNIVFMKTSPEGSRMLAVDDFGTLYVWNGKNGDLLTSFLLDRQLYQREDEVAFLDENTFLYPCDEGVVCYDIESKKPVYQIDCESVYKISYLEEQDIAVISRDEGFTVIQGQSGEILSLGELQQDLPESEETRLKLKNGAVINEKGTLFAIAVSSEEENLILVYETKTGALYRSYAVRSSNVDYMRFADDVLYVADNDEFNTKDIWMKEAGGVLYACDLAADNTFFWTYENETEWLYEVCLSSKEGSDYMLCTFYDGAVVLNKKDGSYIDYFSYGDEIVMVRNYRGRDAFMVFTRDGVLHYTNLNIMTDMVGNTFSHVTSTNVKIFELGDDYYATLPYLSKKITLYRMVLGNHEGILCESENRYMQAVLSEDGAYLAVTSDVDGYATYLEMIDTNTGEVLWHYEGDKYCSGFAMCPEQDALTMAVNGGIYLFDIQTGEQKAFYDRENTFSGTYYGLDATGRYAFYRLVSTLYIYDLADGQPAYEIEAEGILDSNTEFTISPSMKYLAVASQSTDSVQVYALQDLQAGNKTCLYEVKDSNAVYVNYLFFNDKEAEETGLELYVVYKSGDIKVYTVDEQEKEVIESRTLQDLKSYMTHFIQPEGADYSLIAGTSSAYLLCNREDSPADYGEITAYVNGFLAVDEKQNCIYITDGTSIYRMPLYDTEALREEAQKQLGN